MDLYVEKWNDTIVVRLRTTVTISYKKLFKASMFQYYKKYTKSFNILNNKISICENGKL